MGRPRLGAKALAGKYLRLSSCRPGCVRGARRRTQNGCLPGACGWNCCDLRWPAPYTCRIGRMTTMKFKKRTLVQIADMICGNFKTEESFFHYRSSSYLTEFFRDCDTDYEHDGSTRNYWVAE